MSAGTTTAIAAPRARDPRLQSLNIPLSPTPTVRTPRTYHRYVPKTGRAAQRAASDHCNSVRELDGKRSSLPELALASDLSTDQGSQGLTDVEAETGALGGRHRR